MSPSCPNEARSSRLLSLTLGLTISNNQRRVREEQPWRAGEDGRKFPGVFQRGRASLGRRGPLLYGRIPIRPIRQETHGLRVSQVFLFACVSLQRLVRTEHGRLRFCGERALGFSIGQREQSSVVDTYVPPTGTIYRPKLVHDALSPRRLEDFEPVNKQCTAVLETMVHDVMSTSR